MEEILNSGEQQPNAPNTGRKKKILPSVIVVRDWKEYLGEALLIIFSVLLALILTEYFTKLHENGQTREILHSVREELITNERLEKEQYVYHLEVLRKIDSALNNPEFAKQFINNGMINSKVIFPSGVLLHDLNDVAWQVSKQANIVSKIDLQTYSLLTDIYDNQDRINKSEREIASVILSRESRSAADNSITLILMHDNYHGWATDRAPVLINNYEKAIRALDKF